MGTRSLDSDAPARRAMRQPARAVQAVLLAGALSAVLCAPARAHTTGTQTFDGVIVTSGVSGQRTVVTSVVVAKGVFGGVGRVVEVPNQPGDPDNASRDDLVFAAGTMHLISTTLEFSFSLNPRSCLATATIKQTGTIAGGTGRFADAAGSALGSVDGPSLLRRNPDGTCSFEQPALHEVDHFHSSGTLSY
jgi:hypothetical protein